MLFTIVYITSLLMNFLYHRLPFLLLLFSCFISKVVGHDIAHWVWFRQRLSILFIARGLIFSILKLCFHQLLLSKAKLVFTNVGPSECSLIFSCCSSGPNSHLVDQLLIFISLWFNRRSSIRCPDFEEGTNSFLIFKARNSMEDFFGNAFGLTTERFGCSNIDICFYVSSGTNSVKIFLFFCIFLVFFLFKLFEVSDLRRIVKPRHFLNLKKN